jgi:hypothetical protein
MKNTIENINIEITSKLKHQKQNIFNNDSKRIFDWRIKDITIQDKISSESLHKFFEEKWTKDTSRNINLSELTFKYHLQ